MNNDNDDLSLDKIEESQKKLSTQQLGEERFRFGFRMVMSFISIVILVFFMYLIGYLLICKSKNDPYLIAILVGASTLILYKSIASSMPFRENNEKEHPLLSAITELISTAKDYLGKK